MKNFLSRLVSILLSLALILQIVPSVAYASIGIELENSESSPTSNINNMDSDEEISSSVFVLGEVESLRDETEKHFRLTDGTYIAAQYGLTVHCKDGDKWVDIDNSLNLYDGFYSTKQNGKCKAAFSENLSEGLLASLSYEDFEVSMSLKDYSNPNVFLEIVSNEESEDLDKGDESSSWTIDDVIPSKLSSKVIYKDVYPSVDLEYTLVSYDLKEQIILNKRQDKTRFDFVLNIKNLTPLLLENGSIKLSNDSGNTIYAIPTPVMEDAKGNISRDVHYEVAETENGIVLSVVADKAWLNSEDRVYPVKIDPSLSAKATNNTYTSSSGIYTTYTLSYYPYQGIASWGMPQHLFIGFQSSSGLTRGYVHFNELPLVPSCCEVIGAVYGIYIFNPSTEGYTGFYSLNESQMPLAAREVTSAKPSAYSTYYDWFTYLKWNDALSYGSDLDYTVATASSQGSYISWDITGLAKEWYKDASDKSHRTISIYSKDESSYNSSDYACIRSLAYGDTYPPTLIVSYRNTTGIEPYHTYNALDVGNAGTAYIEDKSGQVKAAKEIASYASTVNPVSIGIVYNSDYFRNSSGAVNPYASQGMIFGSGWTLDIVQTIAEETINDINYLTYTDGDGTKHYFLKVQGDNTYYYDEDGLGLKIREISGSYEMSDDNGNLKIFTGGYLTRIEDANGNAVNINYTGDNVTSVTQVNNGAGTVTVATFSYNTDYYLTSVTDAAGLVTTLSYTGENLTGISRGNTSLSEYSYTDGRLTKLKDCESDYSINFTYTEGKASGYYESAGNVQGFRLGIEYCDGSQTVYTDLGADRILGTSDDIITSYLFDYSGRTVNAYTIDKEGELLGATNAVYTNNNGASRKNNRELRTASTVEDGTNLLSCSGFETSGGWIYSSASGSLSASEQHSGEQSLKLTGAWNSDVYAYQDVTLNEVGTESYILSGWAMAESVPNTNYTDETDHTTDSFKQFGLRAVITYSDNTTETHYASFCPDVKTWQYTSMAIVPKCSGKTVASVRVYLVYEKNLNNAYFDDISLTKETCKTMAYDEDGNLVSVNVTGLEAVTSTYSSGNLIGLVTGGYGNYTLNYDSNHNLTSVTDGNVTQSMIYSSQGNVTSTVLTGGTFRIGNSASYDTNGNRLSSVTDESGNTKGYTYSQGVSEMYGLPSSVTDERNVVTNYQYDNLGRTTQISVGSIVSAAYTYLEGLVSSLTRTAGSSSQEYSFTYDDFGNVTSIDVGNYTIADYTYASGNGNLSGTEYGNGYSIDYSYDIRNRILSWEDSDDNSLCYTYDLRSRPELLEAGDGYSYAYEYDSLDRVTGYTVYDEDDNEVLDVSKTYNTSGNILSNSWSIGSETYTQNLTYGSDSITAVPEGALYSMTSGVGETITFSYDALGRLTNTLGKTNKAYTYANGTGSNTTTLISRYVNSLGTNTYVDTSFAYDASGNIASETNGNTTWNYTYDTLGQLTSAADGSLTYFYTYDGVGNILSKSNGTSTHTYSYTDASWKDLLTAYDGYAITYDDCGNPVSYYNGKSWDFVWERGNKLSSAESTNLGVDVDISFNYDAEGTRRCKTESLGFNNYNFTTVYDYIYSGDKLLQEIVTEDGVSETHTFIYDNNGNPYALKIGNTVYYYITNLQGDVTGLIDSTGSIVASYTYDPYGNILTSTGSIADKNPLRYRGYYYDEYTGFYYLISRYYDPNTGRFINADTVDYLGSNGSLLSLNLFAYCLNNPINMSDESGTLPNWATKVVAAATIVAVVAAIAAATVATAGAGTAAAVIMAGAAKGAAIGMASSAAIGATTGAVSYRAVTGSWSGAGEATLNGMGNGALSGAITGTITGIFSSAFKVGCAAQLWDSSSKGGSWANMTDHYKRHVILEGKNSMTKNVITYTEDAVALWNKCNGTGKLMNSGSLRLNGLGVGGFYSQSGLIRSFFYQ